MKPIIRKRKVEDSEELAHAIAIVWNTTYKGIVDEDFLIGLSNNEKYSALRLKNSIMDQPYYCVLVLENKIIGWIYFTMESDSHVDSAEIHSLYVLKEYQGMGYGKLLYDYAVDEIRKNAISKLIIGCLDKNPSNDFYIHLGGKQIGNRMFREKYLENIYLFEL